jgi:hypothetical protein
VHAVLSLIAAEIGEILRLNPEVRRSMAELGRVIKGGD